MTSLFNLLLRLARCTSGTAALEGALVMPVAIALMAGGVEFGRVYSAASTADKSMRDAARYLAHMPCDSGNSTGCSASAAICGWGLTNAKNLAVYGKLTVGAGDHPLIMGWATSNVTLQQPRDCSTLPNPTIIQLKATVPFTAIMLSAVGLSNTITLNVQHEERWIGE
jgi:Flp pilus assembly protein TadG